jgi:hypothetical protein
VATDAAADDEPTADEGAWGDIIAPILDLVGSTGERLDLPR